MSTVLTTIARERSTYIVTCTFTDEDGVAITPTSFKWTLTDKNGSVINGKYEVVVSSLSDTISVLLSGADLKILSGELNQKTVGGRRTVERRMTVEATYNSSTYGNGLPLNDEVTFFIENFAKELA